MAFQKKEQNLLIPVHCRDEGFSICASKASTRDEGFQSSLKVPAAHIKETFLYDFQENSVDYSVVSLWWAPSWSFFLIFSVCFISTGRLFQNYFIPGFRYMSLRHHLMRVVLNLYTSFLCWKRWWIVPMSHPSYLKEK